MKDYAQDVSRASFIVCPLCECGTLRPSVSDLARCDYCGMSVGTEVLCALKELIDLPEVSGRHIGECGHPEMRRLPDGVFWCPACGSEVVPIRDDPASNEGHSEAWRDGWMDGCFRESSGVIRSDRLARWENAQDRLDYYHGCRAGQEACRDKSRPASGASA